MYNMHCKSGIVRVGSIVRLAPHHLTKGPSALILNRILTVATTRVC